MMKTVKTATIITSHALFALKATQIKMISALNVQTRTV